MQHEKDGVLRELNSGPPAPKAGIIPLDQVPNDTSTSAGGTIVSQPTAEATSVTVAFLSVSIAILHPSRRQLLVAGSTSPLTLTYNTCLREMAGSP